jgi:hypothetical protein
MSNDAQPTYRTEIPIGGDVVEAIVGLIGQHDDRIAQPAPTEPITFSPPKPEHDYEHSNTPFFCGCGSHLFARCHGGALSD